MSLRLGGSIGGTLRVEARIHILRGQMRFLGDRVRSMLEEREALVLEVRPFDVHGSAFVDVTVAYPDRSVDQARLGAESVPEGLGAGERVLVRRVMATIVELTRPADTG